MTPWAKIGFLLPALILAHVAATARASDSVTNAAGLRLWYKADQVLTDGASNVTNWPDQTDSANNTVADPAVVPSSATPPVWTESAFGSRPGLSFSGSSTAFVLPAQAFTGSETSLTLFAVIRTTDPAGGGLLSRYAMHGHFGIDFRIDAGVAKYDVISDTEDPSQGATLSTLTSLSNGMPHLITAVYQGSTISLYVDGLLERQGTFAFPTNTLQGNKSWSGSTLLGVRGYVSGASIATLGSPGWFTGQIGEMIAYTQPLSVSARQRVESYLLAKFGIPPPPAAAAPGGIPGLKLWLRADYGVETNGAGRVTTWKDVTDDTHNTIAHHGIAKPAYTQAPVLSNAVFGAKPALFFNGETETNLLSLARAPTAPFVGADTALSLIVAFKTTDDNGGFYTTYGNHGIYAVNLRVTNGKGHFQAVATNTVSGWKTSTMTATPVNDDRVHILSAIYDGTNRSLYLDGVLEDQDSLTQSLPGPLAGNEGMSDYHSLGCECLDNGSSITGYTIVPFRGHIAELIGYNTGLSDTDRKAVEQYLLFKYNRPPGTVLCIY